MIEFKLDWEKIEKAADVRLFEIGRGKMRLCDCRRQWIEEMAVFYVQTVQNDREWPSNAKNEQRSRKIAKRAQALREEIGEDQRYTGLTQHLDAAIRQADLDAGRAEFAKLHEPPMVSTARKQLVSEFLKDWQRYGGKFDGPKDRGPAFRAAVEIMSQCRGGLMTGADADRKLIERAFEEHDSAQDMAQISSAGIVSTY